MVKEFDLTAKPGEPGYTAAYEGGVNVVDSEGNVVGNVGYETEAAKKAFTTGAPLYQSGATFTAQVPSVYADFNKETGNIVIHAPKEVMEMQSFKTNVLENGALQQLSSAYKIDPNYQFPDPNDDSKTISLSDQMFKLNQGLEEYRQAAQSLVNERDKLAREKGEKYRSLSLDNVATAISYAQNDNDRQVIPNYLVDVFKEYESWDDATQSVSKNELMRKWWSYDVSDREDLLAKWGKLNMTLRYSDTRNPENESVDYSMQTSAFPDPDDAARMISLQNFLSANDASTNTAAGVSRNVQDIVGSELYSFAAQFSSGIMSMVAGVTSAFGLVRNPFSEGVATGAAELEKSVEKLNDENEIFNRGAAVMGDCLQALGNLGAILVAEGAENEVVNKITSLAKIDDMVSALDYVSNHEKEIAKGASFAMEALPHFVSSKIASSAATMMEMGVGLAKFLGEVVVDATVDNPQLMAAIMSDKNVSSQVKQTMMEEAAYNGLGMATGLAISKGAAVFSNTSVGKALNSGLAVLNARASTKTGDTLYKIRSAIAKAPLEDAFGAKAEAALEKGRASRAFKYRELQKVTSARNEMRAARKVLANLSVKDTDAIVKQIGKIQALDAAYDLAAQGSKRVLSAIVASDPVLRKSNKAVEDSLDKAIKAQKKAGQVASKSAKYGSSGLSETASQYVSLTHRIHLAETASEIADSSLNEAAVKALPVYQKQMAEIVENMTPEMKIALDEYIQNLKTFYSDMTDYAIAKGLLSEETIASYRANPLFADNNYMRVMVEADVSKVRMQRVDGLIKEDNLLEIKNLQLPAEAQKFVDPEVTRYWFGLEIAKSYNAQNLAKAAIEATGATPTVMASNAEIVLARDVSANATEVRKAALKHYGSLVDDIDKNLTLEQVSDLVDTRKRKLGTLSAQRAAERRLSVAYRKAGVYGLSNEDLSAILKEGGYKEGSAYNELQVRIGEGVEKTEEVQRLQDEVTDLKRQLRNAKRRKSATAKEKNSLSDKLQRKQAALDKVDNPQRNAYDAWYSEASTDVKRWLREQRNVNLSAKIDVPNGNAKVTYEQFTELQKTDNFGKEFDRQTVFASKDMMNSKKVVAAGEDVKKNAVFLEDLTENKQSLKALEKEAKEASEGYKNALGEIKNNIRDALYDFIENVGKENNVIKSTKAISEYGQGDPETITKYLTLQELRKKHNADALKRKIKDKIFKSLPGGAQKSEIKMYESAIDEGIDAIIREEYNDARLALDSINSKVIDKKEWAQEIRELHQKISGSVTMPNVIKVSDGNGGVQLVEVSPNLAFLYNYRPRRVLDDDIIHRSMRGLSKLFRFGQTTFSSKSFIMQGFRDSGNAYFMGNAWRNIQDSADNLVDVFGEGIVQEIKEFEPEYYEKLVKSIEETGAEATTQNIARAEVENVQAYGREISPASTERGLYDIANREDVFTRMQNGARNVADKLDDIFNGKREEYLRQRVFMNALNDALEKGHTYNEAKAIATQMMQNATTNFSRSVFYLDSLAENVPYIRSAINGTASFWRMFSLDPVGVTGRIVSGTFIPYTYLLGQSLADPENAEIYANIPEYEKRDNFVVVVRGQKVSIPIPQEIGKVLAPFRHFVEYLHGAQKNSFWDLLGNDILGLSPVDLTGFSNVDMNLMTSDPTIMDRLGRGTMRLISQLAPTPVKAGWIVATQTDPYTGKRIADTSWTYRDPETGEEIPMGYNQGRFAEGVAKMLGNDNAALVSKVTSSILGTTGEDFMDFLAGVVQLVIPGEEGQNPIVSFGENFFKPQFNNAVSAVYNEEYDRTNQLWRQAIRELEVEKQQIVESDDWKNIHSSMSQATTDVAIQKLRAQRQDMIDKFNQKVADTVQRLQSEYGSTFDRYKMSSVMQLLNFSTNAEFDQSNQHLQDLASDVYYAGRGQAIRTMYNLGVKGTTDYSIFGYLKRGADGSVSIRYNQPTAILDMANTVYGAREIEMANLENTIKNSGLTLSQKSAGYKQATTKAAKKQYKADWNKKVIQVIAPYIQSVGVDEVLNNSTIIDYLDNYIYTDNQYNAKDYIKKLFKGE